MRIVIITQDDPFYLAENLDALFGNLPDGCAVVGCVVSSVSPFGKKESFAKKMQRTVEVFGLRFFVHYGFAFVRKRLFARRGVRNVLADHGIPELVLDESINARGSLDLIRRYEPDLLVSIAGNEIFRSELIGLAPQGCLNLHTAMLPKYRGLMPSFWVLKNRETETGVSVFYVDEGIDSGPILVQKSIAIGNMSQQELIRETKRLGMTAIIEAIERIRDGRTETLPNDEAESTYYSFPTRQDVREFRRVGARFF